MSRAVLVAALVAVLPFPCSKKEEAPPPAAVTPQGPTPETTAKWTKARADYEKSAKANNVKPEVAAAMLGLIDKAKATGKDIDSGSKIDKTLSDDDMKKAFAPEHFSIETKAGADGCHGVDRRSSAEGLGLSLDYYQWNAKDDGVWVTATVGEAAEPLHLVEEGAPRDVKQAVVDLTIVIQAPGKPPVRVERKLDAHGLSMQAKMRAGNTFSKRGIYEEEARMLEERTCAAITVALGLK